MYTSRTKEECEIKCVDNLVTEVEEFKSRYPIEQTLVQSLEVDEYNNLPPVKSNYTDIEFDEIIDEHRKLYDFTLATSIIFDGWNKISIILQIVIQYATKN